MNAIEVDAEGPVAIVTGAGSGIGAACATALAARGCRVVVNYQNSCEGASDIVSQCQAMDTEAVSVQGSVADDKDCRKILDETMNTFGRVDLLINNAGVTRFADQKDLAALNSADFEYIMSVNVTGSYQMIRAAVPDLKKSHCAAVVNVSSHSGMSGIGSSMAYAASKAALNTMTLSLARNLAPSIRVNAVCPGFVDTKWLSGKLSDEALAEFKEKVSAASPLQTIVTPADVADAVCWLGLQARSVTGQLLVIDGGTHLTTASPL
ncbi:MAG TPA: oxidoreductase [Gammaproteobacteria bacterium]|nr:oxidoreductase [Gammaproteobacteria bacterium]|tara:strand:- start:782 stop:1576 length:795 start_codon:yes stop_codon:yes gene_type:complete